MALTAVVVTTVLGSCTLLGGWFSPYTVHVGGKAVTAFDFGSVDYGTGATATVQLSIQNGGVLPVDFADRAAITVSGTAASDFAPGAISVSTVDGGSSATLTLTFTPGALGLRTATITVVPFAGSPQSVTLRGYGGVGQLVVSDGTVPSTSTQVSNGGTYDAGTGLYLGYPLYFYLTNTSTVNAITLDSTPVTLDSPDGAFVIGTQPISPVATNGGQSYVVIDLATLSGDTSEHSATVTIGNSATGSFSFTITAASSGVGS